jgi:hypothetical protein
MATSNPSFMNGVPELLVLRLLRGRESRRSARRPATS